MLHDDFSEMIGCDCNVNPCHIWELIGHGFSHTCPTAWTCPTSQRLKHLESTKAIYVLKQRLNLGVNGLLFFGTIVVIAKRPVVPTSTLSVVSILFREEPLWLLTSCFGVNETLLDDLWLHVNEYRVRNELLFLKVSLKVCLYDPFLQPGWTSLVLVHQLIKEGVTDLVPALPHLNCNYGHL